MVIPCSCRQPFGDKQMDLATVVQEKLSDGSIVYNIELKDEANKVQAIIGCEDEVRAYELARALNTASWVSFNG